MRPALPIVVILALFALRVYVRQYYVWLPSYISWRLRDAPSNVKPVHIFFFYGDHFEPAFSTNVLRRWEVDYPTLANRHRDSAGRHLQHTWFYPGEQIIDRNLQALQRLAAGGYGEVEFHYHHAYENETSAKENFGAAIRAFQQYGFLKTIDGGTHFGFIHGNNGLDNSLGTKLCGVNRELKMLRDLGCYADFTFPSVWLLSQPASVNNIYEAADDAGPKSYDRGVELKVGRKRGGDLVIFQGPLFLIPTRDPVKLFWAVEDGNIHASVPVTRQRVDAWVRANIHVAGKPDWVFVKLSSHAAASMAEAGATLGPEFESALQYLETKYNDGREYVLHYVTAREAYNLARAAQAGLSGDPVKYYDWEIKPYVAGAARGRAF
jgi:hypothetical protein